MKLLTDRFIIFGCIFIFGCASVGYGQNKTSYKYNGYPYPPRNQADNEVSVSDHNGVCVIKLVGSISDELNKIFILAANNLDSRQCHTKWVVLDSPGGRAEAGIRIGNLVRERGYWTSLPPFGGECSSACAKIFISGVKREVPESLWGNKIGLHRSSWGAPDQSRQCDKVDGIITQMSLAFTKSMLPEHAALKFHEYSVTQACNEVKYLTGRELVELGIATGRGGP